MKAIYSRQNTVIMAANTAVMVGLLWLGSLYPGWIILAASAFLFSFLGLTNYALIHEGCHRNLHEDSERNGLLGMITSWLFPVSFTFMQICHDVHHRNNRTDHELFDYYYPSDNRFIKYIQWYGILLGVYPPLIPIGSLLMAFVPQIFWLSPWQEAKSSSIIFQQRFFPHAVISRIRFEVICGIVFWILLFWLLDLKLINVLVMYFAFWFNWSTRQYVTHAFSERDIMNGAWNLRVGPIMDRIFLHGQWDLVHHNYPSAPWQELPQLGRNSSAPVPYWKHYFKQWAGPRPNVDPAPAASIVR